MCAVTAGRESYVLYHLGIHKTQTFLLSRTDQQRTMNLYPVHIYRVLVKRTAADVILATQLIRLAHTRKSDQQTFYAAACRVRHNTCRGSINPVHRTLCVLHAAHLNLRQYLFVRQQLHIDVHHFPKINDALLHRGITDHREGKYHRVRLFQQQFVIPVSVR